MRVRPFFWLLFVCTCLSVLVFALIYRPQLPAMLHVHIAEPQHFSAGPVVVELQFTDTQGSPIDQAHVKPNARMTNMVMPPTRTYVKAQGHGKYQVYVNADMAGPWAITVQARADGFTPQQQTVLVNLT